MSPEILISGVKGRMIYDSRGNPTVECDIITQQGQYRAAVPSGASTGIYEALELRDNDQNWHGKGVSKAIDNINKVIGPLILGKSPLTQGQIDRFMVEEIDGTKGEFGWMKKKLGANAILAVSLAIARAGAATSGLPLYRYVSELAGNEELVLPVPAFNVINGGSHAGNKLAFQEFMILPIGAESFAEALKMGSEIYQHLKKIVKKYYGQGAINVGDEGGFAPDEIVDPRECVDLISQAVEVAGYKGKISLGMDCAASEFHVLVKDQHFYNQKKWIPGDDGSKKISANEMIVEYKKIAKIAFEKNLPLVSNEDPFDQDDWQAWEEYTSDVGKIIQVVGDDLLVTNPIRIQMGIEKKSCNALLLKVNQIGSLTEAIDAVKLAKRAGWAVMTSHRSGETSDPFIADLAVGLATGQIKTGAPCRSERLCKYNQLLRIEEELNVHEELRFAGRNYRQPCRPY